VKESYWYVIATFAFVALGTWIMTVIMGRRMVRISREGPFRLPPARSIWTRDIFDNRVGRFILAVVFPSVVLASGFVDIVSRHAVVKFFDYRGFDAVCIGVGKIGMGLVSLSACTFPARDYGESRFRIAATWAGFVLFVAGFSVALVRNI
jgi:hypothetical protein